MDYGKYIINLALAFVPDLAIAWGFMKLTDGGWPAFGYALVALQVLYLVLWLKRIVWAWVLFWLYQKKQMAREMEKFFRENRFPKPEMWATSLEDYLDQILMDDSAKPELKTRAAFEKGTLNGYKLCQRFSLLMMMASASGIALANYARYAPEPTLEEMGFS